MTTVPPLDAAIERREGSPPRIQAKPAIDGRRVAALDGLRGLAILLIVFYHYFHVDAQFPARTLAAYLSSATLLFWSGVDLFFVLSGFLIGGILLDARESPMYFRTFYTRRAYRILPLYAVVIALYWLTFPLYPAQPLQAPAFTYLTLTQNIWVALGGTLFSPWLRATWSLAVEEQFYLAVPLVIRKVSVRRLPAIVISVICAAPILRFFLWGTGERGWLASYMLTPTRADALLFGVGAALLVRNERGRTWLRQWRSLLYSALGVLAALMLVFTLEGWSIDSVQVSTIGYSAVALWYVIVLLLVVTHTDGILARVFRMAWLTAVGTLAYALYLFHEPVKYALSMTLIGGTPRLSTWSEAGVRVLAFAATLAVARVSWLYFEKPLIQRGHRLRYWPAFEDRRIEDVPPAAALRDGEAAG